MVTELVQRLQTSRDNFLRAVEGIREEQARAKPAGGGWSILECVEHVALAERGMLRMTQKAPDGAQPVDLERDAKILKFGGDRSRKAESPEVALPTGRYATLAEAAGQFRQNREQTIAYVSETTEQALRKKAVPHPLAGMLDGYQILLLMSVHPERHIGQIAELLPRN
jgi:uncharacterized damage-inducible protein DinB